MSATRERVPKTPRRSRLVATCVVVVCIVIVGTGTELTGSPNDPSSIWVPDLLVGVSLATAGLLLLRLGSGTAAGLFLAGAAAWFVGNLADPGAPAALGGTDRLVYLYRGLVVAGVLLVRTSAWGRAAAVGLVGSALSPWLMTSPAGLVIWGHAAVGSTLVVTWSWPLVARAWSVAAVSGLAGCLVLVAWLSLNPMLAVDWSARSTWAVDICVAATGLAAIVTTTALRADPTPVADAVLGVALHPRGPVRRLLADALRDPDLDLAVATSSGGWVDENGASRPRVVVTHHRDRIGVRVGPRVVAELSCRSEVARSAAVRRAIDGASRLVARNTLLNASLRQQADEIRSSQRRLVQVHDDQRRALERRLQDSIAAPMSALSGALVDVRAASDDDELASLLSRCQERFSVMTDALARLAAGLGPASLRTGDLGQALRDLTESCGLAVSLDVQAAPLEPVIATTAYLVCAEAVTNVVKHARASRLDLMVRVMNGGLVVDVRDDGLGGADPSRGTGLLGLSDRLAAFGGSLTMTSPVGGPTHLRAELSLAHPASPIRVQARP